MPHYKAEPYRIKMVEPIRQISKDKRIELLKNAGYNPFSLRSEDVYIDLLTDSGTGAMSHGQWGALMQGDEAYAGSQSFYRLESIVKHITGYNYFLPTHQGRGAEQVVLPAMVKGEGMTFISNTHFDTTRAHVELAGATAVDAVIDEAYETHTYHPFKGNFDTRKVQNIIEKEGAHVIAGIILTITNNSAGGQPVSMANLKATAAIARAHDIPIIIDGARFAENAYFIKHREQAYKNHSVADIAKETFALADIFLMSAKKDGLVNMGGIIAVNEDESLFETFRARMVPYEGFPTYGGMSGRDMEALAVGLQEGLDEDYLAHRIDQVRFLGDRLRAAGVPIQYPTGGHAVFVDCKAFAPHIPYHQFPAQSVVNALYIESGVRAVEIGSLLLGRDAKNGETIDTPLQLMRLTIPRRTYTQNHLEVVAEGVTRVYEHRDTLKGLTFEYESPVLRHFTAKLKYVE